MQKNISVEIPAITFAALGESPDEFVKEMRIAAAIKWYELSKFSQGKAAEVAGLSRVAFIEVFSRFKVSPTQYTEKELTEELADAN